MAKVALCIGINDYPGTGMDLKGCVNDAQDWSAELKKRGFTVKTLLDSAATKKAMATEMSAIVGGAKKGDSVVITFSGHGTYAPDADNDEVDGLDEAVCPHDIRKAGPLIDDEIKAIFATRKPGVSLLLISDSCHSGTVTRAAKDEEDVEGPKPRFMPMGNWMKGDADLPKRRDGAVAGQVPAVSGDSPFRSTLAKQEGDLLLAGCEEGPNKFSYDAKIAGRANGAFTAYALKTLKLPATKTYADWHKAIRKYLPSGSYPQSPQIFGDTAARGRKVFT